MSLINFPQSQIGVSSVEKSPCIIGVQIESLVVLCQAFVI
jgi:hypothetical protein